MNEPSLKNRLLVVDQRDEVKEVVSHSLSTQTSVNSHKNLSIPFTLPIVNTGRSNYEKCEEGRHDW